MTTPRISSTEMAAIKRTYVLTTTLLRPPRVAELLGISVRTLYRLDEEGLICSQPLRPGQLRGKRYSLAAIEEYRKAVMGGTYSPLEISP
jgi:predicted DNA-binding transcriptional regulator AlpA